MEPFPELVSKSELERTISRASSCCENCSTVSILEVGDSGTTLKKDLDLCGLTAWFEAKAQADIDQNNTSPTPTPLTIFFISGTKSSRSYHVHVDPKLLTCLREKANLSSKFLMDVYDTEEWARLQIGSATWCDKTLNVESLCVNYGFWSWDDPNSTNCFVQFQTDFRSAQYFCINLPSQMIRQIVTSANETGQISRRFLYLDAFIHEMLLISYREAISKRNMQLIDIEREHDKSSIKEQTRRLHALSVNWHTISKDLVDLEEQLQHLHGLYDKAFTELRRTDTTWHALSGADQSLSRLLKSTQFYRRWAMTYRDRTESRISLLHHLAMQHDNRLTQDIGNLTTQVALQTQRDSASMITLAVVTTLFLPGTFISSILSTVFFYFDGSELTVSTRWWILPASAIPLTIIVLSVWFTWFRWKSHRDRTAIMASQRNGLEIPKVERQQIVRLPSDLVSPFW